MSEPIRSALIEAAAQIIDELYARHVIAGAEQAFAAFRPAPLSAVKEPEEAVPAELSAGLESEVEDG